MWQHSFKNENATLYLVATPIGNLQELTPRALEVLKMVDVIACEDSRVTKKLCHYFDITTPLVVHHSYNEEKSTPGILNLLSQGQDVALVSDAGTPLMSDPGNLLVKMALDQGFNVVSISGSCALINALVVSNILTHPFLFHGFLPSSKKMCRRVCLNYQKLPVTMVFYVSVHKLKQSLEICLEVFKDRQVALCRELTKQHEAIYRGSLSALLDQVDDLKGEFVLVVEGNKELKPAPIDRHDITYLIDEYMNQGYTASQAIRAVSQDLSISKNEVYSTYLEGQNKC